VKKQFSVNNAREQDIHYLIKFASEVLIDKSLQPDQAEVKKQKFIKKCYTMLQEINLNSTSNII
jgi:hypothetical protein